MRSVKPYSIKSSLKLLIIAITCIIFIAEQSFAKNCKSQCSGNWESSLSWLSGMVPACGDTITIEAGHEILICTQLDFYSSCETPMYIIVNGTLSFCTGKKLMLPAGSVVEVNVGGSMDPGNGGGSSNLIEIGGTTVWSASSGITKGYAIFVNYPLPIRLLNFRAHPSEDKVEILWVTAEETNNDYFTIEKSRDGHFFELVTKIKGKRNSTSVNSYRFEDRFMFEGLSYYRLKQTDFDGRVTYSEIISVYVNVHRQAARVFPNPASRTNLTYWMNYTCNNEMKEVKIFDATGLLRYSKFCRCEQGTIIIPGSDLQRGTYLLAVEERGSVDYQKIVIQ